MSFLRFGNKNQKEHCKQHIDKMMMMMMMLTMVHQKGFLLSMILVVVVLMIKWVEPFLAWLKPNEEKCKSNRQILVWLQPKEGRQPQQQKKKRMIADKSYTLTENGYKHVQTMSPIRILFTLGHNGLLHTIIYWHIYIYTYTMNNRPTVDNIIHRFIIIILVI